MRDKVAVITGGNSGIGYAAAKEFVTHGAKVVITGRRKDVVQQAALETGAIPFLANQASLADTDDLVDFVSSKFGMVDVLFINAGVGGSASIEATTEELFDEVISINFKGAFFTLSKFIPILNNGASVIMLSSNGASMAYPNSSVYSASKAALNSVAKIAAIELAPKKIRVNIVSPGPTKTPILNKGGLLDEATLNNIERLLIDQVPLSKIGSPEDIGSLVAYLCANTASFITGSEIVIDGGMSL